MRFAGKAGTCSIGYLLLLFFSFSLVTGCPSSNEQSSDQSKTKTPSSSGELAIKGKTVYMANCTACHNTDPSKDGSVGPAIAGSSLELVRLRVIETKYPAGYKPKRETHLMQPLPQLKESIEALHAFLNQ